MRLSSPSNADCSILCILLFSSHKYCNFERSENACDGILLILFSDRASAVRLCSPSNEFGVNVCMLLDLRSSCCNFDISENARGGISAMLLSVRNTLNADTGRSGIDAISRQSQSTSVIFVLQSQTGGLPQRTATTCLKFWTRRVITSRLMTKSDLKIFCTKQ